MKKVTGDGIVSAVAGEVRENWRRRRRKKKKETRCVCEVREKKKKKKKKETRSVREVRENKKKKTGVLFSFYFS
jgi:hypothetical protein